MVGGQWVLIALFIAATLPVNLYLWGWRIIDLRRAAHPYYLARDEVAALEWLDRRSDEHAVVLSGLVLGHYIPALTGQRAFFSHWAQTVNYFEKERDVVTFFDGATSPGDRRALLTQYDVQYVIYGADERALGDFNPASEPWMRKVFETPEVAIFQVISNHDSTQR